ncbi:penicillin-insensitive murein endopeptidase [Methylogaea oryzae]|uniref:Penicillin-insensitive murein endopeptidase n=1 Tax=Methylogaea oryzae TaxID=1295382 RepID=A0A8D4VQ73_9GAMM|nr:penicillin-insensitive murein endopeptidase [Methylogaea oryzae]BBL70639.1 penicillin-insensitive murein endopeptidase [Methylogaea oryzae]
MNRRTKLACLAWLILLPAGTAALEPSAGPPRSIGSPANGCLAGALALPFDGPGYSVVRTPRERYYGHGQLLDYVKNLGIRAAETGLGTLLVGDMSQARGGPMPYGHSSHQHGLDVDVWFQVAPRPPFSPLDALRDPGVQPSLLNPSRKDLSPALWNGSQTALLRLAANAESADRIFVNPVIKRELCRSAPGAWLRKLRPWHGHDDHFHVRLACPADSPSCQPQAPLPAGDGCGAELDWWFQPRKPERKPAAPPQPWPAECEAL